MKRHSKWIILLLSLLLQQSGLCQYAIKGKVIDTETKEPLPFVNIIFNHDPLSGVTTDIHGQFSFTSEFPLESLTCSYVGYQTITRPIDPENNAPLIITMNPSSYTLREVVVKAGENPANRIIRMVIENKHLNNPEKIASFRYTSYNKVIYDFDFSDTLVSDSDIVALDQVFKGGHVFVMESVTERKFIHPDNSEEVVLGTKVSGFKQASFAPLATDIQPFSFYEDVIPIIDINYLNPISNGSLSKYDFRIEDTLYYGVDTTFILSFKPQPGKHFEALTGLLYINTNRYAIQNVVAKPFNRGFIDVSLQQQYRFVDGKQWFPEQLKFELIIRQNQQMTVGMRASGVNIIEEVELYPELRKRDFSIETIRMHELANDRDSLYWEQHRAIPLNEREETTYQVLDSLGEKYKFDNKLKFFESVSQGRIPVGIVDLDMSRLAGFNKYEGVRIGLGAYTNDKLVKNFSVGGYFGYGFQDAEWKYGAEAILSIGKEKEFQVTARHQNTLAEVGKSWLGFYRPKQFDFRTWLASQMDMIQQTSMIVGFRAIRYARVNVSLNNTRVDPQYAYGYQADESPLISSYTNTDLTVIMRYAYKERLIKSMGQRIAMGTKYPVLTLSYTRGIDDLFNGQFSYHKFEARIEESVYFKNLGESKIRIDAGFIDSALPYGLLFTGEGSYVRKMSVLIRNSFQTITPYEFLSDRYINVHFAHNFGSLLLQIGNWKPTIYLYQNMGWGSLANPEVHQQVTFKTKEKGFYETGLQLDNLLKFNYLNVSYLGFGGGIFYRYGPYAFPDVWDNFAFTFSMTITTK